MRYSSTLESPSRSLSVIRTGRDSTFPNRTFSLRSKGGIEALVNNRDVDLDAPGLTRIGVIVDADADIAARWSQLRAKLQSCGYEGVPDRPDVQGTIIEQIDKPRFGVWLMPDNSTDGMLEHFVEKLVPVGDDLRADAQSSVLALGDRQRFQV